MIDKSVAVALVSIAAVAAALGEQPEESYPRSADSERQDGVPQGEVTKHTYRCPEGGVFPGTIREYYVYVPAQYDGSSPAALMVFQDGHAYVGEGGDMRVPVVFDNLIHQGKMPVTVAVLANPGLFAEALPEPQGWKNPDGIRSNRSVEYDTPDGEFARFLEAELLPAASEATGVEFTDDPDQRAICGMSSGGICAFTTAWERPDLFRKVLSHIGSFTNIRGGYHYPHLLRKTEPKKPIRVFLQGGANDLDNAHGNWPLANQQMAAALQYADYDHQFAFGEGGHNGKHGGAILPESLVWLWRNE
ncbi:alpha/beta hydrolase-fold protein [soil metagenome]